MTSGVPDFRRWGDQIAQFAQDTERLRAEFERIELVGVSPDGNIRATMRSGKLVGLEIAPAALNHDTAYLAAQIVAAVQDGERQGAELMARRTSPMTDALQQMINEAG